jgi:hypothetical protein
LYITLLEMLWPGSLCWGPWVWGIFVSMWLTIQTTPSQYLNFCKFSLLLSTSCFGHSFDHHPVEKL